MEGTDNPAALCKWLTLYVAETRKQDGCKYPPKTLYSLLTGLLRHSLAQNSKWLALGLSKQHITQSSGLGVGDIPVRRYYRGKLSHGNHNRTSFSSRQLLRNMHYCVMRLRSGPHARGTTMASSTYEVRGSSSLQYLCCKEAEYN